MRDGAILTPDEIQQVQRATAHLTLKQKWDLLYRVLSDPSLLEQESTVPVAEKPPVVSVTP